MLSRITTVVIGGIAAILIGCSGAPETSIAKRSDLDIFETFKQLEGDFYEVDTDGNPAKVEYRLISRGTALTETWFMSSGTIEMTVFHMDNGILTATHYCAAGLQSTMHLQPSEADGDYDFALHSISNLGAADQSHNSGFGYSFDGDDKVLRREVWTIDGEASVSNLTLMRGDAG